MPLADRDHPATMKTPLRDLRAALWPRSASSISAKRLGEHLRKASDALDSWDAAIPWTDERTGKSGSRRVVLVGDVGATLDDDLQIIVNLPPGAVNGPIMPSTLGAWGARSATAYRMLIGLRYRWHEPGLTRYPVRGTRGKVWANMPDGDVRAYPEFSDDDLLELAYPHEGGGRGRVRRWRLESAREALQWLAQGLDVLDPPELRIDGRRLLPPGHPAE